MVVRLSACQTRELWQNERNLCLYSCTATKIDASRFATRKTVRGVCLLYLKFKLKWPPPSKTAISHSIFACSDSAVKPSEKCLIITNKKSTKGGGLENWKWPFSSKNDFFRRKSATKFVCVKTCSGKVVRHSPAYLTVHKWLVEDDPFYLKFSAIMIYICIPPAKRRLPIDIRS